MTVVFPMLKPSNGAGLEREGRGDYFLTFWAVACMCCVKDGWTSVWDLRGRWAASGMMMILGTKGQLPSCPVAQIA